MLYDDDSLKRLENKKFLDYEQKLQKYLTQDRKELIKEYYKSRTGEDLNIDNPVTYNEKLQWLKYYWRDNLVYRCADKYEARFVVAENGTMKRDYTFIADVVVAVEKIIAYSFENQSLCEIFNIGSSNPVCSLELIEILENQLGIKAIKNFLPQRCEEIDTTFADCSKLEKCIDYKPNTSIDKGLSEFVNWYNTLKTTTSGIL